MINKLYRAPLVSSALCLALAASIASQSGLAQDVPAPVNKPYLAPIELHVNATNLRQKIVNVREHMPVKPRSLTSILQAM